MKNIKLLNSNINLLNNKTTLLYSFKRGEQTFYMVSTYVPFEEVEEFVFRTFVEANTNYKDNL